MTERRTKYTQGTILDGRNRWRACQALGIPHRERKFGSRPGDGKDPFAYVWSVNAERRHLNSAQLALAAAEMANVTHGGSRVGVVVSEPNGQEVVRPLEADRITIPEAARITGVSESLIKRARMVRRDAVPTVLAAVQSGALPLSPAARIAKLPREQQEKIMAENPVERIPQAVPEVTNRAPRPKPSAVPEPKIPKTGPGRGDGGPLITKIPSKQDGVVQDRADSTTRRDEHMGQELEPGAIVNASPRPRMLIRGFNENDSLVSELLSLCPTAKYITSLRQIRQGEWDLLVTDSELTESQPYVGRTEVAPHMFVVYRAQEGRFYNVESRASWDADITCYPGVISQEIRRIRNLPERISALTHEQLEPVLKLRVTHWHFDHNKIGIISTPTIEPFIITPEGEVLAGKYARGDSAETWMLPPDTPDLIPWVKAALGEWHALDAERFPGVPDWSQTEAWQTNLEASLSVEIAEIEQQRRTEMERLDLLESTVKEKLQTAKEEADSYERMLLTAQSDDLKFAVMRALTEFGFSVEDADEKAKQDDHLEDLHITDPDTPEWIALGEVKGYTKGAKTEGLTQFLRFNMRFSTRTGRNPDACWYIANQFAKRDPSSRQPALHGKDEDVSAFGLANGLVIDTVDLFKLLKKFRQGAFSSKQAKAMLKGSAGRFSIDSAVESLPDAQK